MVTQQARSQVNIADLLIELGCFTEKVDKGNQKLSSQIYSNISLGL